MMSDLVERQMALNAVEKNFCNTQRIYEALKGLPPVKSEILVVKLDDILEIFPPESFLTELISNKLKDKLYHLKVDLS